MPGDIDEVTGEWEELQLRQEEFTQNPADVYAVLWSAAGGFGDPLERDPALVESDIEHLNVSEATARDVYGVALRADGTADREATERLREAMRKERLARARPPEGALRKAGGKRKFLATAMLAVHATADGPRHVCAKCDTDLGPVRENYKERCARDDRPIQTSNPIVGDPSRFIDDVPQFRQFYCPGCGALIENEIAIASEPLLRDVELRLK
jgi:N-methylhydantoinase B